MSRSYAVCSSLLELYGWRRPICDFSLAILEVLEELVFVSSKRRECLQSLAYINSLHDSIKFTDRIFQGHYDGGLERVCEGKVNGLA